MSFADLPIHILHNATHTHHLGPFGLKNLAKKVRTALEMKKDEIAGIGEHTWIIYAGWHSQAGEDDHERHLTVRGWLNGVLETTLHVYARENHPVEDVVFFIGARRRWVGRRLEDEVYSVVN